MSRWAAFCYRHRRLVLLAWVVAFFALPFVSRAAGDAYSQTFKLPASDSQQATDLLKARFPSTGSGFSGGEIVFNADAGATADVTREQLNALFDHVSSLPGVQQVGSPYANTPAASFQLAPNGTTGYATVTFEGNSSNDIPKATLDQIQSAAKAANADGLQVELGGQVFQDRGKLGQEWIGLIAAVVILLVAFGSVVAMGLPIVTSLFGLGIGFSVVALLAHVTSVPQFATQLAAMIGLGVGIDYALFIVTRYRQGLHSGLEPEQAVITALDTAGRAVFFAGCTVVISLAGMLLIGVQFIQGLGLSAAAVVAVTMAASLTLLPAVLGFVGYTIDKWRIPGVSDGNLQRHGFWYRWSRYLQHHPWPFAIGGFLVLILLAVPVLSIRLGSSDASNLPTSSTTRRAYDIKAAAYGPGASGPLVVVAELPAGSTADAVAPIAAQVAATPGVAFVSPPRLDAAGDAAQFIVTPTTSSQDAATTDLTRHLRNTVLPEATAGTGITAHVGGITALFDDLATQLQTRLPIFIGVVLLLSFLLLMLVFRSIVVPLKAVIMNLLSIGAAYGVIVAVFQWGWGASFFGVGNTGPIESFLPMMMFAILFGLSMDYEVFLLSRIKEEYDRTGNNSSAVADGLNATARVITAAALIMVTVFGSFIFGDNRVIKMFGLGLAVAVFIDATLVRMVLVPATMELLGKANWWFPKWLQWLPEVHVEGSTVATGASIDEELAELVESEPAAPTGS